MAALAIDDYTGTPEELLERARRITEPRVIDFSEVPALLLTAVNKRLAEIAPGEDPRAIAKRLTAERNEWSIESAYELLTWYYKDSLNPKKFKSNYDPIDHEEQVWLAEGMLRELRNHNA